MEWPFLVSKNTKGEFTLFLLISSDLAGLDALEEQGPLHPANIAKRRSLKAQFLALDTKEEILWKQKGKSRWLKDGDMNSSYFHRLLSAKKQKNIVEVFSRDGISLLIEDDIERKFVSLYKDLYTKDSDVRFLPSIDQWTPFALKKHLI